MDEKDTSRLEAFSDGVFAVAITLLVLDIKFSPFDAGKLKDDVALWREIGSQWPALFAFITSFCTIGVMWLNHHRVFKHIKRADTPLIFLNLLLLLIIVFIPVPTNLLAEYLAEYIDHPEYHTAAIVYGITFLAMAACFSLLWRYASHRGRLLGKDVDMDGVNRISRQYAFGPLVYAISIVLALVYPPVSVGFNFLLAVFFALPEVSLRRRNKFDPLAEKDMLSE